MRIHRIAVSFLLLLAYFAAGTAVAGESFTLPKSVEEANNKYGERRHDAIGQRLNRMWNVGGNKGDWKSPLIDDKGKLATNSVMIALAALRDQKNLKVPQAYRTYAHCPTDNFKDTVVEAVKDVFNTNGRLLGTRSKGLWAGKTGDLDMDFARVMSLLLEFDEIYLKPEARAHIVRQLLNIKKDHTQREDMTELTLQTEVTPAVKNAETENHTLSINTSKYLLNQYVHEQLKSNTETGRLLREAGFKDPSKYDPAKLTRIRDWILQACARILHNDLFETNARPYQGITFLPLFNIFAYANDITLKNAARNALDAIAAKMAFQSFQGTRYPPIRRSNEHMHEYQLLRYDYLLSTMGILSGARPGVNWRGVVAVMLNPEKPRYELPAAVHSYFLNQSHSYWARMQGQYTTKHYEYGKDPKYFVDGKPFNQGDFRPAVELYFRTPSYLNTSGGRYDHYPVSMERSFSYWTVYGGAYAYDFLSVPQTVITHPVMVEDDNDKMNSYEALTNHSVFDPGHGGGILNMLGNERRFWKSDNSGTFKNFAYGFRFPTNKSGIGCRPGYVEEGWLCYKPCKPGYKGVVTRCLENCPAGTVDDGVTCRAPIETKAKTSYGRTAGKPMGCGADQDEDAGLCYNKCGSDYHGIGPYCYRDCPSGFRDDGLYCAKPKAYGRGAGYPWKIGDKAGSLDGARARCKKDHSQGCEKHGAIIYPKCKEGFHAEGCCVCSPDCPTGMKDIGVSCEKQKFSRGVGKSLHTCAANQEKDGFLCYPHCRTGYNGKGPVCWSVCPSGYTDFGATCTKGGKVTTPTSYDRGAGEVMLSHDAFGDPTKDAHTKKPWNVPSFFNFSKCKMIRIGDMVEVRLCDNLNWHHDFYVVLGWIRDNETKEYSRGFWEIVPRTRFDTVDDLAKHVQETNKNNFPAKGNFKYRLATSGDLVELRRDLSYVKDIGRSCSSPIVSIQDHKGKALHSPEDPTSTYYYNQCKDSNGVPYVASLPLMEVFEVDEKYQFTGNILAYAKGGKLCAVTKNSKLCLDSANYKNPTRSDTKCTGGACSLKPW